MSGAISPAEALAGIPGWEGAATRRELGGGLTNRSYRVERGGESYVLRLDSEHTGAFGLDRDCELRVIAEAAARGLAPDVIYSDREAGILLRAYVRGRVWGASDMRDNRTLEALAELLRRVHALPACGKRFDAKRFARRYVENLESHEEFRSFGARCHEIVDGIGASRAIRCCHNDVIADNVIASPRPMLLDWEYACDNDPMFDLASPIGYHDLNDEQMRVLLSAYAGGADPALSERLRTQIRLFDALQWLWLANRQAIRPLPAQAARLDELRQRIG